jgi:hypothetical protein
MASLTLTPRGHLLFTAADGTFQAPVARLRALESAFNRGSGHGLLELGAAEVGPPFHQTSATGATSPRAWSPRSARTQISMGMTHQVRVRRGILSVVSISASRRTAKTTMCHLRFSRPTRRSCRSTPRRSTFRSAARCANASPSAQLRRSPPPWRGWIRLPRKPG